MLLLDTAERGEPVIIERRGIRFRVRVEGKPALKATPHRTCNDQVRGSGSCYRPLKLGLGTQGVAFYCCQARTPLILLDTNAFLWLQRRHKRSRPWSFRVVIRLVDE